MKVLLIIASKMFRDEELFETKKVLETAGLETVVASSTTNEVTGKLGGKVTPSALYTDEIDFDILVFVGGGGAAEYFDDRTAHNLANKAYNDGKIVAAICIAPKILAGAGLLKGKRFTVWPDGIEYIKENGGLYIEDQDVVIDGRIITANGPHASKEFGKAIVEALI